jgi:hypothetical protein
MAKYSVDDDKAIIEVLVSITTNGKTKKGIFRSHLIEKLRELKNGSKIRFKPSQYSDQSLRSKAERLSWTALTNGIDAVYPEKDPPKPKKSAAQKKAEDRANMLNSFSKSTKKSDAFIKAVKDAQAKIKKMQDAQAKAEAKRKSKRDAAK